MWPQVTLLIIYLIGLGVMINKSDGGRLVALLVTNWLLYEGGFWAPLFH